MIICQHDLRFVGRPRPTRTELVDRRQNTFTAKTTTTIVFNPSLARYNYIIASHYHILLCINISHIITFTM